MVIITQEGITTTAYLFLVVGGAVSFVGLLLAFLNKRAKLQERSKRKK